MKRLNFLSIFILIFASSSCYSQQMMKTQNDVQNIKKNEKQFINQPLKDLIKEIKPQIKRVTANPSKNIQSSVGYFIFNFVDSKQKDSLRAKRKIPITIVVYVKEYFDWDFHKRQKGKEFIWTKEDLEKYGDLTVVAIRAYGEE